VGGANGGAGGVSDGVSSAGGGAGGTSDPPSGAGGAGGVSSGAGGTSDGAGGAGVSVRGIAIQGSYTDNFDGSHVITNSEWTSGSSVFHIAAFDNSAHFIIARNDQSNLFNPCLWSRFDWTVSEGALYYCQTAYDAESQAAALAKTAADSSDLAKGCSGFSWSQLTAD
jgi:hypothetical protein